MCVVLLFVLDFFIIFFFAVTWKTSRKLFSVFFPAAAYEFITSIA